MGPRVARALQRIAALADAIDAASVDRTPVARLYAMAREIRALALDALSDSGVVRANPLLTVFGNPGRGGRRSSSNLMSNDVLAVLYRHKDDGEFYVHGFGDATLKLDGSPKAGVGIGGLKERTGVRMVANEDGSVTLFHDRHPIHKEF